jgi:hypothetical protein
VKLRMVAAIRRCRKRAKTCRKNLLRKLGRGALHFAVTAR